VSSGLPFSLSGDAEPPTSQTMGDESCSNDYIVFPGGYSFPPTVPVKQRDRFCGSILSQAEAGTLPQTICSKLFIVDWGNVVKLKNDLLILASGGYR